MLWQLFYSIDGIEYFSASDDNLTNVNLRAEFKRKFYNATNIYIVATCTSYCG